MVPFRGRTPRKQERTAGLPGSRQTNALPITVAGPRRIHTGLPPICCPFRWGRPNPNSPTLPTVARSSAFPSSLSDTATVHGSPDSAACIVAPAIGSPCVVVRSPEGYVCAPKHSIPSGVGCEKEPGENPGLSRSGMQERPPSPSTGSSFREATAIRSIPGNRVGACESEDLPIVSGTPCPTVCRLVEWARNLIGNTSAIVRGQGAQSGCALVGR